MKYLIDKEVLNYRLAFFTVPPDIWEAIQHTPIVDAVPVVHGKWIHDGYDIPHGVDWMHCSVCGQREPYVPAAMTNYCTNCGARMDEKDGDGK